MGKKTTVESRGPRFEIKDFLVKLGSVTVGGVFKGILVEVEYCPGVVPNNCWGILLEFMQGSWAAASHPFLLLSWRLKEATPTGQLTRLSSIWTISTSSDRLLV